MALPLCPRCGYDLTGVTAAWEDSCPLEGVCSECGLGFTWVEVWRPELFPPSWSFEHGEHVSAARWIKTAARGFFPVLFWGRLRLSNPMRRRTLCLYVVLSLVIGHLLAGLVAAASLVIFVGVNGVTFDGNPLIVEASRALLAPQLLNQMSWRQFFRSPALVPLGVTLWMTGLLCVLPDSLQKARVRYVHLLRVGAYSVAATWLAWNAVIALDWAVISGAMHLGLLVPIIAGVGLIAFLLWLAWWWWLVIRRYLRLPRAGLIYVLTAVTAVLGACTTYLAVAMFLLEPG
jgi:hypothetical protein